jgi:hypothetical protein
MSKLTNLLLVVMGVLLALALVLAITAIAQAPCGRDDRADRSSRRVKDRLALVGSGCLIFVVLFGGMIAFSAYRDRRNAEAEAMTAMSKVSPPKLGGDVPLEQMAAPAVSNLAATTARTEPSTAPPVEPSSWSPPACILSEEDGTAVTLWPTIAGLDAYQRVATDSKSSGRVRFRVRFENGAFSAPPGARCEIVESVPLGAKVRILEGESRGRLGWVPHPWHMGKPGAPSH